MAIQNGDTIRVRGYEFTVTQLHTQLIDGVESVRFIGVCTASPINDDIRHTGYNGGTYSL